jgi:hypothetical protein
LKLGTEGYSPAVLIKIEYAGANEASFGQAAKALAELAELTVSAKHVQRLTERLGQERLAQRERQVAQRQAGQLKPLHGQPPTVAVVHVDAGKVQMRSEDGRPGVRQPHWSDTKVACLQTYSSPPCEGDPRPQPPAAFLDPPYVVRLCQELAEVRCNPATRPSVPAAAQPHRRGVGANRPVGLVRTAVATTRPVEEFGWMVSAEAMRRGFYQATRRAIVGDGGNWIGPLGQQHFTGWLQVLDFVHLLAHLYGAAMAAHGGQPSRGWSLYERMLRAAWAGKVQQVQASLQQQCTRLGRPPDQTGDNNPARVVAATLAYVTANAHRMDYPRYRQAGLPVSSAAVESLVKQFNQRVKGTEKFWVRYGVEAVLQVRAAYLSDDDRGPAFHAHRPRSHAAGRHRLRPAA